MKDACRREVSTHLQSPGSAKFGDAIDVAPVELVRDLQDLGGKGFIKMGDTWKWFGYVDSQNGFGASRRTLFVCDRSPYSVTVKLF